MDRSGPFFVGLDLGTTAVKCAIHALDGSCLAAASSEFSFSTTSDRAVELDPDAYWAAICAALNRALTAAGPVRRDIVALGLSCQGETLLPVDKTGDPLRPAIVWLDARAEVEALELSEHFGHAFYEVTGQTEMVPTWPAAKALWLYRHESGLMRQMRRLLLLEDYVAARMTGEYVTEGSLVTSTGYWDFRRKSWWPAMLDKISLDGEQLPVLLEPGSAVGPLREEVAQELGLPVSTVVCLGALDQACGAIGVGNVTPGIFSENTGAAVAICATLPEAMLDPDRRLPCHYHGVPDTYMFHTFTAGGVVLQWYRDGFCAAESEVAGVRGMSTYRVIDEEVAAVPVGADGVVMVPHLQGAMAPEVNPRARGAFVGLTLHHTKAHLARAVLESIAYVIRHNIEVLESLGVQVSAIRSLGGGARSAVWKQIEADVTQRPVSVTAQPEAATLGAAMLASVALGWFPSVAEAVKSMVSIDRTFEPDEEVRERYDECYARYRAATKALADLFD